jgi:hypothetical protein
MRLRKKAAGLVDTEVYNGDCSATERRPRSCGVTLFKRLAGASSETVVKGAVTARISTTDQEGGQGRLPAIL